MRLGDAMTTFAILAAIAFGIWLSANDWHLAQSLPVIEAPFDSVTVYVPLHEYHTCVRAQSEPRIRDLKPADSM